MIVGTGVVVTLASRLCEEKGIYLPYALVFERVLQPHLGPDFSSPLLPRYENEVHPVHCRLHCACHARQLRKHSERPDPHPYEGALAGGALGALAGGIIGNQSGRAWEGA